MLALLASCATAPSLTPATVAEASVRDSFSVAARASGAVRVRSVWQPGAPRWMNRAPIAASIAAQQAPQESPYAQARACLRSADYVERNACVIRALAGRATACNELGLLASAYRDSQQTSNAIRTMQQYIRVCSSGPFVASYENYIRDHRR